jgi:hypothetical protein
MGRDHAHEPAHKRPSKHGDHQHGTPGKTTLVSQSHERAPSRGGHGNGIYAPPGDLWTGAGAAMERRVEKMIEILERHTQQVAKELDKGVAKVDRSLIAHMERVLQEERGALQTALVNLPSGSPLQIQAFATAQGATAVLTRLAAVAAGHQAQAETGMPSLDGDDRALALEEAEHEAPAGYCDTAVQHVAPCELDRTTRDRYRRRVAAAVGKARENWKNAIAAAQIEEKLKTRKLSFEQQLGELLLGMLFSVIGAGVKAIAAKGLEKGRELLTMDRWDDEIGFMQATGPDAAMLKLGQGVVDTAVEKGAPLAHAKLKEGITARELAGKAKQPAPSDRVSFLASLKTLPDQWHDTIIMNLENLFDADLAALVIALPLESPSLSVAAFEARINELVTKFEQQVQPIGQISMSASRPLKVVTAHGVKHALVQPEQKPNKDLHGEWKFVAVNTGKWRFVTWIADDMKDMALSRARSKDEYADVQMKAATDASFWNEESLRLLALETSSTAQTERR